MSLLPPCADYQPNGAAPLASFGTAVKGQTYTYEGPKDFSTPKAMTKADMDTVKAEIVQAARNSLEAGACPEPLARMRIPWNVTICSVFGSPDPAVKPMVP